MKDLGLRLFSLLVALTLYLIANSQINQSVLTRTIPVELRNLPQDKMVLLPKTMQVTVTMKGPSILIKDSAITSLSYVHSIPSDVGNSYQLVLQEDDIDLPSGIEIVGIQPDSFDLILDKIVEKKVPVEVTRIGHINENVRLEKVKVTPPQVTLRGPETELQGINIVETEPIDFRDIEETTTLKRDVRLPSFYTKPSIKSIFVTISVSNIEVEKKFSKVAVEVRSSGKTLRGVKPDKVDVEISGPRRIIRSLKASDIVPFVRISEASDELIRSVEVDLPPRVNLVQVEPSQVQLLDVQQGSGDSKAEASVESEQPSRLSESMLP